MNPSSPIRKVYQGIADRRQMFRMFDRHTQRPNRFEDAPQLSLTRIAVARQN